MATKCRDNNIIFIGPNPETISKMGDKTAAKSVARECDVPVVPGTDAALLDKEEAFSWCEKNGLPVMMKASMGGGGRGMRVVRQMEEVKESF
jgi:acetyl/propionyl-CoA carboxylase alpha subunit